MAQQVQNLAINEIKIAESVSDNYYREFNLPNNINGFQYTINIITGVGNSTEMVIRYNQSDKEIVYFLESYVNSSSTIGYGLNNITKNNGIIEIQHISN